MIHKISLFWAFILLHFACVVVTSQLFSCRTQNEWEREILYAWYCTLEVKRNEFLTRLKIKVQTWSQEVTSIIEICTMYSDHHQQHEHTPRHLLRSLKLILLTFFIYLFTYFSVQIYLLQQIESDGHEYTCEVCVSVKWKDL